MATAAEIQTTLSAYKTARDQLLGGRVSSVQIEGQSYSFLAVAELEKQIADYETRLALSQSITLGRSPLGIRARPIGMGY